MSTQEPKPRYFEATFSSELTGDEKVSGTFTEEEHERLVDYMDYAEDLCKTPFLHSQNRGSLKLSQKRDEPLEVEVTLPDWNEVAAFIHVLRPLILQNEPTSFYNISALIGKYTSNSRLVRLFLSEQKELFSTRKDQKRIQYRSNDELLNSEKVLQAYLNGFEYHRDKDKQVFIKELHQMIPLDASKVIFVGLLLDKAKAILNLADAVAGITGKQKEVTFTIPSPDENKAQAAHD